MLMLNQTFIADFNKKSIYNDGYNKDFKIFRNCKYFYT